MEIPFQSSERSSLGVEWELQLVDRETRELAAGAVEILEELGPTDAEEHPKAKHELLESTIEIITGICSTVAEATADLAGTLAEVGAAADRGAWGSCARAPTRSPTGRRSRSAQGALPAAGRADAVAGPAAADLRRARARRRPLAGEGHPDRQRAVPVHPALPGPLGVLALLEGRRHGAGLGPLQGLRGPADRRAALPALRLGRVRGVHGDADLRPRDRERPRGVVGHPPPPGLRHRRAAHLRRAADPGRDRRGRGARASAWSSGSTPRSTAATRCRRRRAGSSARTSGGPPATASTPRSSSTRRAPSGRCGRRSWTSSRS